MKLIRIAARYLKRYPFLVFLVFGTIVLASFFEGASFGMLIPLIQSMTQEPARLLERIPLPEYFNDLFMKMSQGEAVTLVFICMLLMLALKNVFVYLSDTIIAKLRFGIIRDLRVGLMDNLIEYDLKYFDSVKTGYLIGNFEAEINRMGEFLLCVLQFTSLLGRVLAYIMLLLLISWKTSLIILFLITTVLLPVELIMRQVKKIGSRISQSIEEYSHKLTEILNGMRLIKGSGTDESEKAAFAQAAGKYYKLAYKNRKYSAIIIPFSEVFIFGLVVCYFLVLMRTSKLDVPDAFPFIATYLVVFARMLTQLNALNSQRANAMANVAAFQSYEQVIDPKDKKTIVDGAVKITGFNHSIEFKGVNFSYTEKRQVLKNIDIMIPRGKVTALIGASGAGKSTIINLIMRFYDVSSGAIMVDGINIKDLILKEWRKKIGFVSQDIFVFNASIKDNISYGHCSIPEEQIVSAAKIANAHDFITTLSEGYRTVTGDRGVKLSGGQKQRISIARAIIHNPEILILDEATSSLDTETERLIREAIERVTKDRTVIAIAHRLSTILHADNIIVLSEGCVVEGGRHEELLKKNGFYKRLYETQFSS